MASITGRVHDLTKASPRDWARVYNQGSDYDSPPITEQDLYTLFKRHVLQRENLLVGYDGPVPTSVASIIQNSSKGVLGIGDFIVVPGRETAGFNLINYILQCARKRGYHQVVAWMCSGNTKAADVLGLFVFELGQVRVNMTLNIASLSSTTYGDNNVSTFSKSSISPAPSLGSLLHDGLLSAVEYRDLLIQKWYPFVFLPLSSESQSVMIGYCSRHHRRLGWLLLNTPRPSSSILPSIAPHEVSTIIDALYSHGARTVITEASADRATRNTFEKLGFTVNHTLYRLVFDLVYTEK